MHGTSFTYQVRIVDAVGNVGANTASQAVTIDTAAPAAAVAITAIAADSGTSSSDFVTNDTTLTVSGTHGVLGAGEKVQVSSDGGANWADATSTASTWSYTDPTTHGTSFTYQARIVDTAGNVGANTASQAVTIDTAAPAAPSITSIPENSGGGIDAGEASDGTPVVVGLAGTGAAAGDTLTINWGSQTVNYTLLAGDISGNSATVTVPLATIAAQGLGTFDVTARLTDAAGNASCELDGDLGKCDIGRRASPTAAVAITAIATDSGASSSDFVTNDTTLAVSGTHGLLAPARRCRSAATAAPTGSMSPPARQHLELYRSHAARHELHLPGADRRQLAQCRCQHRQPGGDHRHGGAECAVDHRDPGECRRRHRRRRGLGRHTSGGRPGGHRGGGGRHADHQLGRPDGQLHTAGGRHLGQQRDGDGASRRQSSRRAWARST